MSHLALATLLSLVATACTVVTSYPESWPKPDASMLACQPPAGTFNNLGTWAVGDEEQAYLLADILFPLSVHEPLKNHAERRAITRMVLDANDPLRLRVRAFVGSQVLFERDLPVGTEHCRDGHFVFDQGSWTIAGSIGAAIWSKVSFQALQDSQGGLLLRGSGKGGGLVFMVIPFAGSETTWWRFPALVGDVPEQPYPPREVRTPPEEVWQLLPPASVPKWGSYDLARQCLNVAQNPERTVTGSARKINLELESDDFLTGTREGALAVEGWAHPKHGWVPGSHDLRVKKQHWAAPATTDRYLDCLLNLGFYPERRSLGD